jgi:hypothetical protein
LQYVRDPSFWKDLKFLFAGLSATIIGTFKSDSVSQKHQP